MTRRQTSNARDEDGEQSVNVLRSTTTYMFAETGVAASQSFSELSIACESCGLASENIRTAFKSSVRIDKSLRRKFASKSIQIGKTRVALRSPKSRDIDGLKANYLKLAARPKQKSHEQHENGHRDDCDFEHDLI